MGLDMFLFKAKRIDGATTEDVCKIEKYLYWLENGQKYTPVEWYGFSLDEINLDLADKYAKIKRLDDWGGVTLREEVGYWRKANQIHNYFVEQVQDGEDDCGIYEVTKGNLEDLLVRCCTVKVICGIPHSENQEDTWEQPIQYQRVAEQLLPVCEGFFFGDYEYNQYYMSQIDETISIILKVLTETDFENEMIMYGSSW